MHRERLQHLAKILDAVPPERFDKSCWSYETDCGTVACAAGWAALDPEFQKAGLTLVGGIPACLGRYGEAAVRAFFDLTWTDSENLFLRSEPSTPAGVAAQVRSLLARDAALEAEFG